MTDDIMNKLDELQSLCDAATPGRWDWLLCVDKSTPSVLISRGEDGTMYTTISSLWLDEEDGLSDMSKEDADFITAAREYMPQLISALKKVSSEEPHLIYRKETPCKHYKNLSKNTGTKQTQMS